MDIGIKKTVTLQLFDVGHALNSGHLYRVGQLGCLVSSIRCSGKI